MSTKDKVLKILEENKGSSISGEDIAVQLNVSRSAVWKAIQELRKEGYTIEALTNKGYSLSTDNDVISVQGILPYINNPDIKNRIYVYKTIESTNLTAKKMALDGALPGTVVIAEEQTQGRGRRGRSFFSPADTGIYMSILLKPNFDPSKSVLITTAASVAVCRAIEAVTGIYSQIKWVNDIYVQDKKVCGILTEAVTDFESGHIEHIVLGIGINFKTSSNDFPQDIRTIAGSIYQGNTKGMASRNQLIAEIINELFVINEKLEAREFIKEYRSRSMVLEKEIKVIKGGSYVDMNSALESAPMAIAIDIDEDGGLVVQYPDGSRETLSSGEISIRVNR